MILYDDFNLRLVADGAEWRVLAHSPAGDAGSPLDLDATCAWNAWSNARTQGDIAALGARLFEAITRNDVGRLFDFSLGALNHCIGRGLRIRILVDPRDPRLRLLASLPWELLYCTDTRAFVGLNPRTPIVRSLDALHAVRTPAPGSPLCIVLAAAQPRGAQELSLAQEARAIETACRHHGGMRVTTLANATLDMIRHQLTREPCDVLHFMGHGRFDETAGQGSLLMESDTGDADPVTPETLAVLVQGHAQPSLVVLNACDTARSSPSASVDPCAGIAASLVVAGIPAVLAMRSGVYDDAAVKLASELYARIAAGDSLDAAVTEARRALFTARADPCDWTVPVLFSRPSLCNAGILGNTSLPDARSAAQPILAPPPPAPEVSSTRPVHRGARLQQSLHIGSVKSQHVYQAESINFNRGRTSGKKD